jgi:hypothetical protein
MKNKSLAKGIIRARSLAASTLIEALDEAGSSFTEKKLADCWMASIKKEPDLLPFGWYQPPPNGMSVLTAKSEPFKRLNYMSLRDKENWPSPDILFTEDCVLYPYFSAIDRKTSMIGDFVGTFYNGSRKSTQEWMREVYKTTKSIVNTISFGMKFSDIFSIVEEEMHSLGASNNTFSLSGGLSSDVGHTVPFFESKSDTPTLDQNQGDFSALFSEKLANNRDFLRADNHKKINSPCAFTIEPQFLIDGEPMTSFHMIVIIDDEEKIVVENFSDLFDYFGMTNWLHV